MEKRFSCPLLCYVLHLITVAGLIWLLEYYTRFEEKLLGENLSTEKVVVFRSAATILITLLIGLVELFCWGCVWLKIR